jgi:ubiquitin-protein ligase
MLDNDVTDFIKENFEVFKLLVNTTTLTINSPRVLDMLDPFPNYFLKSEYKTEFLKKKRGTLIKLQLGTTEWAEYCEAKDISSIVKTLNTIDPVKIADGIENFYPTDQMLSDTLGKPTYQLLRFIIKSCCVNMEKEWSSQSVQIWKITHPFYVENQFKDKSTGQTNSNSYLFHGSNSACWYSILRNGIKVLSSTTLQKNGAAYGPGIYVSDSYNFALGYSLKSTTITTNVSNCIVGVYEVLGEKKQYYKAPNIYVIPTHESCLLKYLIVGKPTQTLLKPNSTNKTKLVTANSDDQVYDENKWINDYFSTTLTTSKSADSAKMKVISNKKLAKEFKQISETTGYSVKLIDGNILDWEVTWSGVTLAFKFPQLYPFEPPFVFVKSPRFSLESSNITSHGAICCEYLTKSNWLPAISIENLIVQIFAMIIEPNLHYIQNKSSEYFYSDAVKSYEKIAKGNGWL